MPATRTAGDSPATPKPLITVAEWWDLYQFTGEGQVDCPDCDQRSPECENVYQLVEWINSHIPDCPA